MDGFVAGRIGYFDAAGETGREWFESVPHAGGRTLRAFCEMDDVGLSRDVTYALDAASRPVDAYVRVIKHGRIVGSTLFLVEPDAVACLGTTLEHGRVAQRQRTAAPLAYLGLHPLVGDALVAPCRGTDRRGEFVAIPGLANSTAPNGDAGLIGQPITMDVAYLGEEDVAVAAGRFRSRRYALRWQPEWPAADLWVHGDLAVFVKMTWAGNGARYELQELRSRR